ncbi:unnamed protein product, partial [Prorocentrum cordatum]
DRCDCIEMMITETALKHRRPFPETTIDAECEASELEAQGAAHPRDPDADPELLRLTWRPIYQPCQIEPDANSDAQGI